MNKLKEDEDIVKFCYNLLLHIPENEWLTSDYTDGKSKCDVIGHIRRLTSFDIKDYSLNNCVSPPNDIGNEASFLRIVSKQFMNKKHKVNYDVSYINDNITMPYPQLTPKKRVLTLLDDILKERE